MELTQQIHHMDCLSYMKSCPNAIFDLVIADPPYFMICGDFDFEWQNVDEYIEWCKAWVAEIGRIMKSTASFYLWGKIGFGKGFALFHLVDWIEKNNLFQVNNWITQRNVRGRGTKRGFMEAREELVFMTKSNKFTWHNAYTTEPSLRNDNGYDGKPRKNKFKRCSDVWVDITEASQSKHERFRLPDGRSFPTVKPLKASCRIIEASSNPGDLVYIPFGGSGTEAVACTLLNRNWQLTEKNANYIQHIICPRLAKLQNSYCEHG